jgi:hypothetical protein
MTEPTDTAPPPAASDDPAHPPAASDAPAATLHTGGCHCGRVRFTARGAPLSTGWCHCTICRRTTGAPALAWVTFPRDAVAIGGEPVLYRSSPVGGRVLCPVCGAQIAYRGDASPTIDLNAGVFDHPERYPPAAHGFYADHVSWFDAGPNLPKVDDGDSP